MTITVGTNSYVTISEFEDFATDRGYTLNASTDAEKEALLIRAMDYLESQDFIGKKAESTQSLQWPRTNVYIDGYRVASDSVPVEVENAQMAIAYDMDQDYDPLGVVDPAVKREKVDVLEVEYQDGALSKSISPLSAFFLKKITIGGGGSINVSRA